MTTNAVQPTEFLYTWYEPDDAFRSGEWWAHIITKQTPKLVFVQYKVGGYLSHYPRVRNLRISRADLEKNGVVYWDYHLFHTEYAKNKIDLLQKSFTPKCFGFFGLTKDATVEDIRRAYREFALKLHPDQGGTSEDFLKLQENYQAALKMKKGEIKC